MGASSRVEDRRREGSDSYLHSARRSSAPRRHTVSEASEEMKSPIIEKSKMGQEDDSELLVKGESPLVCMILYSKVWTQPLIPWFFFPSDDLLLTLADSHPKYQHYE